MHCRRAVESDRITCYI